MTRFFPSPSPIRCLFSLFLFRRPHPICHVFNQLDGYAFIRLRPRAGYELDIPLDGFIAIQLAGIVLQGNLFVSFVLDIFQLLLFSPPPLFLVSRVQPAASFSSLLRREWIKSINSQGLCRLIICMEGKGRARALNV